MFCFDVTGSLLVADFAVGMGTTIVIGANRQRIQSAANTAPNQAIVKIRIRPGLEYAGGMRSGHAVLGEHLVVKGSSTHC